MPKNDNAHLVRMIRALEQIVGDGIANEFAQGFPLSQSANPEKKHAWASQACGFLEERCDGEQIAAVRKACRCNDGASIAQKMSKYFKKADSIKSFTEAFNANETFARLEYISENKLLFCYPQCYCACVKRVAEPISKIWCYCTLGNAQGIFEKLLEKEIKVSLLESIKSGGTRCAIEVEWEE